MMPETVRHESVVGSVCGPVVGRFALFGWLVPQPRCVASFSSGATLVRHTLGSALIECIALALEPCHRCRIGVAGPNVQLLTVLAGLVGVEQAEVLIEAFVDRRRGSPTATGREQEKAERETRSGSKPRLLPLSHIHLPANTATLCYTIYAECRLGTLWHICAGPAVAFSTGHNLRTGFDARVFPLPRSFRHLRPSHTSRSAAAYNILCLQLTRMAAASTFTAENELTFGRCRVTGLWLVDCW